MVGQMQSCRTFLSNVIDNEYWEHTWLDGFGIGQSRDRGRHVPNILEISGRLNIQRGSDLNKVAKPNRCRPRRDSDSPREHDAQPFVGNAGSRTSWLASFLRRATT